MAVTDLKVVTTARAEIGTVEAGGPDGRSGNDTKYGRAYRLNPAYWCSMFVWWVARAAGLGDLRQTISPHYASADAAMRGFMAAKRFSVVPHIGWAVFYHLPNGHAGANHTGIVSKIYADGSVDAVEGNTNAAGSRNGGMVLEKHRGPGVILGYGDLGAVPARRLIPKVLRRAPRPVPAPVPPAWYHRVLSYPPPKTNPGPTKVVRIGGRRVRVQYGVDVAIVQGAVGATRDMAYGPGTAHDVESWQANHMGPDDSDGVTGPATSARIGARPAVQR